ncbi:MAG: UDP-N-acetylmuramoyl-tripeptide--D-alanyl-D-alanine ligase [Candidatus Kaiserbacteria bacterium]|nr:UDP-N-acetylmuramoyl-tripeptide--D-alanyl-D-alanine ligase [Candidatus Kaiserbacteria bacterium]
MIPNFLSRYRPRYIRSLIYMLQSCEYNVRDYLAWYRRTKDFSSVEVRKQLVKTPKATGLFVIIWIIVIFCVVGAVQYVGSTGSDISLVIGVLLVLALPFYLPYVIIIPVLLARVIQKPFEYALMKRARKKLELHQGLRVAIAGSFGKTSMREILKTVLSEGEAPTPQGRGPDRSVGRKKVAAPPFSHNTPIGICRFINGLNGDEEVLIFELGEYYPGDVMKLCKLIDPQIGVITGINEAHLEKFGTLEKTAGTILELSEYMKDKPIYMNGENGLARKHASGNHILYSRDGAGDFKTEDLRTGLTGTNFTMVKDGIKLPASSKLLGLHNVGPLLVAACIASKLGYTSAQTQAGIAKTKAFNHRLEPSEDKNGVITIDDSYNGNPDGVNAIIEFLSSIKGHRRWYVTPGLVEMGARTEEVHKEIGRHLARSGIEKIVLIKDSVTSFIEWGLKDSGYAGEIIWFNDALQAYSALPHLTVKGDIVLLQNDWPDQYS